MVRNISGEQNWMLLGEIYTGIIYKAKMSKGTAVLQQEVTCLTELLRKEHEFEGSMSQKATTA
jgi:hypothetical protein